MNEFMRGCKYCNNTVGMSFLGDLFDPSDATGTYDGEVFTCRVCNQQWTSNDNVNWYMLPTYNLKSRNVVRV